MTRYWVVAMLGLAVGACDEITFVGDEPAAPRALDASYYAGAVTVSWELAPGWDGESFRVYGKRASDGDYYLIAEVTSCVDGLCSYTDANVQAGRSYDYYVAAFDPGTGLETATESAVRVEVPQATPPPAPGALAVIALDDANYVHWNATARDAADFSHYRVYLEDGDDAFLLGETDSEGFLDLLAQNGSTYRYFVTALDDQGHESAGSAAAAGTPRPDYQGEWVYDYFDLPESAGFRFRSSDDQNPIVDGDDAGRHFRLETDASGWWLVPGAGVDVYPQSWGTTALKCGVGADADCVDQTVAPTSGYVHSDIELIPQSTYVLRVRGDDGQLRYGAVRVSLLGADQEGRGIMIFDWAYQLQPGNPRLAPRPTPTR